MVSASSDNSLSRASPRNSQPGCRPSFTHFQRSHRVDDKSTSPQRNIIITCSKPIDRPVCFSSEQQFPIFCSWKPDPDAWEIDTFSFPWIQKGLCFPTILPGGKSSSKSQTRQVSEPSSCDTLVAISTMVSPSEKFSHYTATISEGNKTDFSPSSIKGSPPLLETAEASCMGCLRRRKNELTLSKDVRDVLAQSIRPGTSSQYNFCWQYFANWCISRETDPAEAPLAEVLEFLSHLFRGRGLAYKTINCYRSAISSFHAPIDGSNAGKHPLVSRFLKGVVSLIRDFLYQNIPSFGMLRLYLTIYLFGILPKCLT